MSSSAFLATLAPYLCLIGASVVSAPLEAGWFSSLFKKSSNPTSSDLEEKPSCPTSGDGWFVTADYLFCNAWQEGLELAGKGEVYPGNIESINYDWTSGFKVALGCDMYQGWGIKGEYTYLRPSGSKQMEASSEKNLYSIMIPNLVAGGFQWDLGELPTSIAVATTYEQARGSTRLSYNVFDLEFRRACCCLSHFDLFFVTGAQGALIDQRAKATFSGNAIAKYRSEFSATQESIPFTVERKEGVHFAGGGLKGAIAGEYHHCGFVLSSQGAINVLFGKYRLNARSEVTNMTSESGSFDASNNRIVALTPALEGFYGLQGKSDPLGFLPHANFNVAIGFEHLSPTFSFRCDLGYEFSYWFHFRPNQLAPSYSLEYFQPFEETTSVLTANIGEEALGGASLGLQGAIVSLQFKF